MWPSNMPNYSWGPWIPQNNGNFGGNDQVDWGTLAKQWMQHRDMVGVAGPEIVRPTTSNEVAHNQGWSPAILPQQQAVVFPDVENYNTMASQATTTSNPSSVTTNKNIPAWAVPPPPPPLPPDRDNVTTTLNRRSESDYFKIQNPSVDVLSRNELNNHPTQKSNFSATWNQSNISALPSKSLNPVRSDFNFTPSWMTLPSDGSILDAAKRKQLPAWIKEGLEKMEREKYRQLEKEREIQTILTTDMYRQENEEPAQITEETEKDSESDYEVAREMPNEVKDKEESVKDETLTEEEKLASMMIKVRRMLTEILLEVTSDEISSIANSVYHKAMSHQTRAPPTFAMSSALASISALGGEFESDEEDDDGSDENSSSDEDVEVAKQRIQKKMDAFEARMSLLDEGHDMESKKILSDQLLETAQRVALSEGTNIHKPDTDRMDSDAKQSMADKNAEHKRTSLHSRTKKAIPSSSSSSSSSSSTSSNESHSSEESSCTSSSEKKCKSKSNEKYKDKSGRGTSEKMKEQKQTKDAGGRRRGEVQSEKKLCDDHSKKRDTDRHRNYDKMYSSSNRSHKDSCRNDKRERSDSRRDPKEDRKKRQRSEDSSEERRTKSSKKERGSRREGRDKRRESWSRSR